MRLSDWKQQNYLPACGLTAALIRTLQRLDGSSSNNQIMPSALKACVDSLSTFLMRWDRPSSCTTSSPTFIKTIEDMSEASIRISCWVERLVILVLMDRNARLWMLLAIPFTTLVV